MIQLFSIDIVNITSNKTKLNCQISKKGQKKQNKMKHPERFNRRL